MNWNLRHCARHGHATYRPTETALGAHLTAKTPVGQAWRCLRCGDYVVGEPSQSGPAAEAPEIPRGAALRDLVIMRLLAVDRGAKGLFLILAALSVWRFKGAQAGLSDLLSSELPLLRPVWAQLGWNIDNSFLIEKGKELLALDPSTLNLVILGLLIYAAIQSAEAVGLWLARVWGEYLAVIASSAFLPIEVWEIVHTPTVIKVGVLIVNLAAVVWLIWSKRLFGVRGGQPAHHAERASASLLTVQKSAAIAPPVTRRSRTKTKRRRVREARV